MLKASRWYGFATSAHQFQHFGTSLLPLRRVPLACRRSPFTIFLFQILCRPLLRAQSILTVPFCSFGASVLARRHGSFSVLAEPFYKFLLSSYLSRSRSCSKHLGGTILQLRRISFSTSARHFCHLGVSHQHVGGALLQFYNFKIFIYLLLTPFQSILAVRFCNFGTSILTRRHGSFSHVVAVVFACRHIITVPSAR